MEPRGVARQLHRLVRQVELPDVVGGGGVRVADRVHDHLGQVDRLVVQRPPRVEAGQQEEVVDERRHPDGLGLDPADRVGDSLGTGSCSRRVSSAYPRIEASGVRSSWLASATNWRTRSSLF